MYNKTTPNTSGDPALAHSLTGCKHARCDWPSGAWMDNMSAAGIQVLPIADYARDGGDTHTDPADHTAWANLVAARYVSDWRSAPVVEIWNEPWATGFNGNAPSYLDLFIKTANALWAVNPDVILLVSGDAQYGGYLWRQHLLAADTGGFLTDPRIRPTSHDYCQSDPPDHHSASNPTWFDFDRYKSCYDDFFAHGHADPQVWVTEYGWEVNEGTHFYGTVTEAQQASYIVAGIQQMQASGKVEAAYCFYLQTSNAWSYNWLDLSNNPRDVCAAVLALNSGSPSSSLSPSPSLSKSPSSSVSPSPSASVSPSASQSPSASVSPSSSTSLTPSPSSSVSPSVSPSGSVSPSASSSPSKSPSSSVSPSPSASVSPSASGSPSASKSPSSSPSPSTTPSPSKSPSASVSPSVSPSKSPSASKSPSSSKSPSKSPSASVSSSVSPSTSASPSPPAYHPRPQATLQEIAALPLSLAQPFLERRGRVGATAFTLVGWHGTSTEPHRFGSYCVVHKDGPFANLVGRVLRVTHRGSGRPPVYVYAIAQTDDPELEELTLTRRMFIATGALPWEDNIRARIEVVPNAGEVEVVE